MRAEVFWTKEAREDLLQIYVSIGLEQRAAAERYYDRIDQKVRLLAVHSRLGARRSDIRPALRMPVERPYLILYRTEPDTDEGDVAKVEIIRVVDGRRDLPEAL